jgi:hypothetical protein
MRKRKSLWMVELVVLLVWIACLVLLHVIRWILCHNNSEGVRLEINAEETTETERKNHNNSFENVSEVRIVKSRCSCCLIKRRPWRCRRGDIAPHISGLYARWWLIYFSRFISGEIVSASRLRWGGGFEDKFWRCGEGKIICCCRKSNPDFPFL